MAVDDRESSRRRLEAAHGVRGRVRKQRELWILDSTRILCADGEPGVDERLEHDRLWSALGLDPRAMVAGSYIDLLAPTLA
jgi:hypothetical protein